MHMTDLIEKKKQGQTLTQEELHFIVHGYTAGDIPDYQMSALMMAIYFRGMTPEETAQLTIEMEHSGDVVDLSPLGEHTADKHSTGGVGDKTTLIVAPLVAECGVKIAKMSGRGLGHTGGTVDKLEAIPGFNSSLSADKFIETVNRCGLCVTGQSGNMCPADKKLYSLRDATETVGSIPLIASSIMSKKLAGGADCIVLDVKCGSGAFMKDIENAKMLAETMVGIGKSVGRKVAALITDMDVPLGNNIGNSLEVIEAVETLKGNGPSDLTELSLSLASKLLCLAGKGSLSECRELAAEKLSDGSALEKLAEMVELQGGDPSYILDPSKFASAPYSKAVTARESGYISHMDTEKVGLACMALGAGRQRKDDIIDPAAGIVLHKKTGDNVEAGETVATLFASDKNLFAEAAEHFAAALTYSSTAPAQKPVVFDTVE